MSSNQESCQACTVIGGLLAAAFIASLFFKWMKDFWIELGQAFSAFGNMAGSFISMLWNILQVVTLLSLIVAGLCCAVYFTIKYYEMVKKATDLQKMVAVSISEFESQQTQKMKEISQHFSEQLAQLDDRLTEALTEPEIAPAAEALAINNLHADNETTAEANDGHSTDETEVPMAENGEANVDDGTKSDAMETVTMSNPL